MAQLAGPERPTKLDQATTAPAAAPFVLHLPGIGGERSLDRMLVHGLALGGFAHTDTYDWTERDPGLNALLAIRRNQAQAKVIARRITTFARANPGVPIHLIAHSGGTGVAAWALEALPPDVQVHTLVLLASALSPDYDLSAALRHVAHKAYAFTSLNDTLVLGAGTRMFGTIDGKKVEAAGRVGFVVPAGADLKQYDKFTQFHYDPAWMQFDNVGDHIGPMHRRFAEQVLAPLMLRGQLPPTEPATRPATSARTPDDVKR
jgi:pimeloyl-ACP methyl ester carboxylesterase